MFNSDVLEVGVGLVLFFLLASLIASAMREMVETAMKTRAMELERGIRELLDDPSGQGVVREFFDHSQIFSLFKGAYDPALLKADKKGEFQMPRAGRANLPAYIPSGNFATAVIDLVARGGGPYQVASDLLNVDTLRQRAASLPSPRLQRAVLSAIDHAEGDMARVKKNLEDWFNGTMDRVSGWYKRRTQYWLLIIGALAAVVFNLDALTVANRLINDHALREAAVGHAEKITGEGKSEPAKDLDAVRQTLSGLGYPIGWRYTPLRFDGKPAPRLLGYELQLPLPAPQTCLLFSKDGCAETKAVGIGEVLGMITGWLITAAAISFGAPFWFDILNKLMVIRSTVKPREKSQDEGSEDRPLSKPPPTPPPTDSLLEAFGAGGKPKPPPPPAPPEPVKPLPVAGFEPETWREGFVNKGEVL